MFDDTPIYLSAADDQLEKFSRSFAQDTALLPRSLAIHGLLQPHVVIPDMFFFSNPAIDEQIRPDSILIEGLREGVVRPAFREFTSSTFSQAFDVLKKQGISNIPKEKGERIANAIDLYCRDSKVAPTYWPNSGDVGEGYEATLKKYLQGRRPPHIDEQLWETTSEWRTSWLDTAVENTRKTPAGRGLRRAELNRVVAKEFGVPGTPASMPEIVQYLRRTRTDALCSDVETFLHWTIELYHLNQSAHLGSNPTFPHYDLQTDLVIREHLPVEPLLPKEDTLDVTIPFPKLSRLLTVSGREFFRLRQFGVDAILAIRKWERNELGEEEVKTQLQTFGQDVAKRVNQSTRLRVLLSREPKLRDLAPLAVDYTPARALLDVHRGGKIFAEWRDEQPSEAELRLRRTGTAVESAGPPSNGP